MQWYESVYSNMNNLHQVIQTAVMQAVATLYPGGQDLRIQINPTPAEFVGDFSVVVFPLVKIAKKAPDVLAEELGTYLLGAVRDIQGFNVVKGFLNLEIGVAYWQQFLHEEALLPGFGKQPRRQERVLVEFSSPNTNKPLHLGHIRNILLGWSCARLLDAIGYEVVKVQIINDRGVAICKSMVAWQTWGQGRTPESEGIKSDHFVGDYYVRFEQEAKVAYERWQQSETGQSVYRDKHKPDQPEAAFFKDYKNKWFNEDADLGAAVRTMLVQWENKEAAVRQLWETMNNWVYAGFDTTYRHLGVSFDKLYYESDTYLLGKDIVAEGLEKGVFYRKEDGSVWVDLTDAGHDHKVVLRGDGTSVYITQDLGTARLRYADYQCENMVYVVADEQNYHFAVLFEILKRLGEPYAGGLHHLSYGLVELPSGRMKTREGTVVDADDLMEEVVRLAMAGMQERGEAPETHQQQETALKIGMAALKYFIIKVHPHKKMIFNPEESVDLQGQTGPYIQYSYVRIRGLLQRVEREGIDLSAALAYADLQPQERALLINLHEFPDLLETAARQYDPSLMANYCYTLAKNYHRFWHDHSVFNAPTTEARAFRLQLSKAVGQVLQSGMELLGIDMPERM
jgi:arginyl-tRNA synthetase